MVAVLNGLVNSAARLNLLGSLLASVGSEPFSNVTLARVRDNMLDISKASWELGTAAQALTEVYTPGLSVFSPSAFPPPSTLNTSWTPVRVLNIVNATLRNKPASSKALFPNQGSAADPASLGPAVLLANWTRTDKRSTWYSDAAQSQLSYLLDDAPRSTSGAISHRAREVQLWSDFTYMVPPFIAYYGALQSDKDLLLEAYNQCRLYRDALQDISATRQEPTWRHIVQGSFQDNTHWATGNGWAAAGMMRVLATFNHSSVGSELRREQANLVEWIDEILVTSWKYQEPNGALHNVLDDLSTFTDTSATALIAATTYRLAAFTRDFKSIPSANHAVSFIQRSLTPDGWLEGTVDPIKFHSPSESGEYSPEGQAFVLLLDAAFKAFREVLEKGGVVEGSGTTRGGL